MKRALIVAVPLAALVLFVAVGAALAPQSASSSSPIKSKILAHKIGVVLGTERARGKEMPLSGGVTYALLDGLGVLNQRAAKNPNAGALDDGEHGRGLSRARTEGCQNEFHGHGMTNTRVNQDCSFRRQAEEMIQLNPNNEHNIIAGQNDSRIGFNHCGYDWTFNGGNTWGDQVPPFYQFVQLDGHTADACSDPTGTWDTHANAYVGGVFFDINSGANSVSVMKSNAGNGGAFYHTPAPLSFQEYRDTPVGLIANDDGELFANDKELMTADQHHSSPKRDNVYMTWTRFNAEGHSPIYFSQSTDGAATWSDPTLISGSNTDICTVPNVGPCEDDQGSDPVVGPDGTIYVAFANGNIPGAGIEQVLFVKCPVSADCSQSASWTAPTRVDTMNGASPVGPDPITGCSSGRTCLPPNGYRMGPETSVTISVDRNAKLYVTYSDFRNGRAPCTGPAASATPPCDNDVFYSFSTDGGTTWAAPRNITPRSHFGENAQWQPWSEVTKDGSTLWVGYYDRHYGNCETTGCNDITAAEIAHAASDHPSYDYTRVTTHSMPNLVPGNNPIQAGFLGDYMWVDTDSHNDAHLVWADTRPIRGTAPEEDVYYAKVHDDHGHGGH
ncbi:MAG: sialidase family protein [Actinomycetota bacterium]